jgi:hypothetical protein
MKYILWCLLLLSCGGYAQDNARETEIGNATGNPYLLKDWSDGVIVFTSGRVVKQFKLRFDCVHNRLMLQFDGASFAAESQVREFVIYTKSGKNKDSMTFKKGFPGIDGSTDETFYQVLVSGKATLLRLFTKTLIEEKQLVGDNGHRRLEDDERFFLLQDGAMLHLPRDKNELAEKLPAQTEPMKQFVAQQTLRMEKADDFVKIISKYNELLQ